MDLREEGGGADEREKERGPLTESSTLFGTSPTECVVAAFHPKDFGLPVDIHSAPNLRHVIAIESGTDGPIRSSPSFRFARPRRSPRSPVRSGAVEFCDAESEVPFVHPADHIVPGSIFLRTAVS